KCGAVVSCEIDAIIKLIACDGEKGGEITQITSRHQDAIDTCNVWEQISAFAGNHNRQFRLRKMFAQSRDRGSCQDQIADSLKLQEKNFHFFSFFWGPPGSTLFPYTTLFR